MTFDMARANLQCSVTFEKLEVLVIARYSTLDYLLLRVASHFNPDYCTYIQLSPGNRLIHPYTDQKHICVAQYLGSA